MNGGTSLEWTLRVFVVAVVAATACKESDSSKTLQKCCNGLGTCLPRTLIPSENSAFIGRNVCGEEEFCLPNELIDIESYVPKTCRATLDAEGRCIPKCLPDISKISESLQQGGCPRAHLCAPCYDLITGESTGLCNIGNDTGPKEPPVLFDECCDKKGRCLPEEMIAESERPRLNKNSCETEGLLCVPDPFLEDNYILSTCNSYLDAEGRCVPTCLSEIQEKLDDLPQSICPDQYRCAPCYDPMTGDATGSCEMGADPGPNRAPVVFETCCNDSGRCIPTDLMTEEERSLLGLDTCKDNQGLACVPDALMEENYILRECRGVLKAEGRCLPSCIPEVAANADTLEKDVCAEGRLCALCYDPFSGEDTGVCHLGADPGPVDEPMIFEKCCNQKGRCLPDELIAEAQIDVLWEDTCPTQNGLLCVPDEFLEENFVLKGCRSNLGAEGRCVPVCLPDIAAQADDLPMDICLEGYRCAPCHDPYTGDETGLCGLGGDTGPSVGPVVFEKCCEGLGSCLPNDLIPTDAQEYLGLDSCPEDQGLLCTPDEFMEDDFNLQVCNGVLEEEGRCVPKCLPSIAEQAELLIKDVCPEGTLCVPCYDLFTGDATGICRLGADPGPEKGPVMFNTCCEDQGWCIPSFLVPSEQLNSLGKDTCASDEETLCVPDTFLKQDFELRDCRSLLGAEGRCAPVCLPDVAEKAESLPRDTCPEHSRCVPCFDPMSGDANEICSLGGDAGPTSDPVIFDRCCGNLASCVPQDLVPEDWREYLGTDTCAPNKGLICAPDTFLDDEMTLTKCHGLEEAEGRCVPECLPTVAEQADFFEKDVCVDGYLCIPCYDPFNAADTGICTLGSDPGPTEVPVIFDTCCGELGTCVPANLIPTAHRDLLDMDGCDAEQNTQCAPDFLIEEKGAEICRSILNAEGRCLPECLSLVADQKDILPADICPPKHLCAPCYDLFTGLSTGVCELPGDSGPTRPPVVFEACCDAAGVCLPGEMVPTDHRNLLGAGTCSNAADFFCVPNVLMEDEFSPKVCRSIADLEGRCLPECLPMIEARSSFLPSDVCEADFRCAPCYDPFDGHDTGACALPNDPGPLEAPVVFNKCCESSGIQIGTCMPSDSLPPNMTDQLISDSCTKPDYLCVPDNIISIPGATGFPSCTSSSGETGGCVPACYLSWEEALVFPRADCGQGEHCVECVWAGQSTGVCS